MARKFNIGDTVQVVKDLGDEYEPLDGDFKVGHKGTVIEYNKGDEFPYGVTRRNGNNNFFKPQELKLIKRKTKTKNKNKGD